MEYSKQLTCCFTGHRHIATEEAEVVVKKLHVTIAGLSTDGVRNFLCGGAIGFDLMAASCTIALKEMGHNIHLVMVLPCNDQDKYWDATQRQLRDSLIARADEVLTLADEYKDGCMKARNAFLVKHSAVCVCHVRHPYSGAGQTLRMAEQQGLRIIRL